MCDEDTRSRIRGAAMAQAMNLLTIANQPGSYLLTPEQVLVIVSQAFLTMRDAFEDEIRGEQR